MIFRVNMKLLKKKQRIMEFNHWNIVAKSFRYISTESHICRTKSKITKYLLELCHLWGRWVSLFHYKKIVILSSDQLSFSLLPPTGFDITDYHFPFACIYFQVLSIKRNTANSQKHTDRYNCLIINITKITYHFLFQLQIFTSKKCWFSFGIQGYCFSINQRLFH